MTDEAIIDGIEKREGWPAFTSKKNDPPTKGGITLATLRLWRNNPALTAADLQALDRPEARAIYQFLFLQPFAAVADDTLRIYLIDLGVLRGARTAAITLQEIVGAVPADGWIGPETIKALKPFRTSALLMLIGARFVHIEQHIHACPEDAEYRQGWRTRNASFLPKA